MRARRGPPIPLAGDPEQLSTTIVDVLTALADEGAVTLPDGVPTTVTVERPRQKGHGDYATNVALQLAKKAGMNPRDFADARPARLEQADGIAAVEVAGPGFLNITVDAGAQGEVAARDRRRRRGVRRHRRVRRREDQPRVRLRQPDRPAAHRRRPVGGGRRRARPDLRR